MKRYQNYMDGIRPSDGLHSRLLELTVPKKTAHWQRYGALAAALALAVGVGAYGLDRLPGRDDMPGGPAEIGVPEPGAVPEGPEWTDSQPGTAGGYEVTDGDMALFCILPAVIYNEPGQGAGTSADYSLAAPDALSREAGLDDVKALLDGGDMSGHLLWTDELGWSGTLWFSADGTPCAAALSASGDGVELYIEMMAGGEVPSCVRLPDEYYETTTFCGVEITALKNTGYAVVDGVELRETRELSCYAGGVGYKLRICGTDGERVENMCARFARWAIVEGFDLAALSAEGAAPCFTGEPDPSVGEPNYED